MQAKELNYKNRKLAYRVKGHGPLVVLLHGFPADGDLWQAQVDAIENIRFILPDLPGSSQSELLNDMSMEGMADAVKAIIDAEAAGETCTMIGHSMGGYITLAFADKYAQALNAFGLFHSTAFADSEERKAARHKAIETTRQQGVQAFLKSFVPGTYSAKTKEVQPALIEEHLKAVRNFSGEAHIKYFEVMMERPDRTTVLKNTSVPVLFVIGAEDKAVPVNDSLIQSHIPATSQVALLKNTAHWGMREEPDEATKILKQFITTIETIA